MMQFISQKRRRQKGSIVIIALVLLMLVTLMGLSITQITSIEIQVAGNERDYKQVFYLAEAAMMEALQRMENAAAEYLKPSTTTFGWLRGPGTNLENKSVMADENISREATVADTARFAATARGITGGSSLAMTTTSQLYSFEVYGYAQDRGRAHVASGFRRRF
jgi:Tfp pilus assembly protein PilX